MIQYIKETLKASFEYSTVLFNGIQIFFFSAAFGGKDLMFSDSASELMELAESTDSFIYLREDYYEAMRALRGDTQLC